MPARKMLQTLVQKSLDREEKLRSEIEASQKIRAMATSSAFCTDLSRNLEHHTKTSFFIEGASWGRAQVFHGYGGARSPDVRSVHRNGVTLDPSLHHCISLLHLPAERLVMARFAPHTSDDGFDVFFEYSGAERFRRRAEKTPAFVYGEDSQIAEVTSQGIVRFCNALGEAKGALALTHPGLPERDWTIACEILDGTGAVAVQDPTMPSSVAVMERRGPDELAFLESHRIGSSVLSLCPTPHGRVYVVAKDGLYLLAPRAGVIKASDCKPEEVSLNAEGTLIISR